MCQGNRVSRFFGEAIERHLPVRTGSDVGGRPCCRGGSHSEPIYPQMRPILVHQHRGRPRQSWRGVVETPFVVLIEKGHLVMRDSSHHATRTCLYSLFQCVQRRQARTGAVFGLAPLLLILVLAGGPTVRPSSQVLITFRLTLTAPVTATDTFSAFVGARHNPPELVLCGPSRGEGVLIPCARGKTFVERLLVPANASIPFSLVRFTGHFGNVQRSKTFFLGRTTVAQRTTISTTFPAPTVPVTFRLHLYGTSPRGEYFAVNYPRGGLTANDLQFCTSATLPSPPLVPVPQGFGRRCTGRGALYTTTIQALAGQTISFAFYRVKLNAHYLTDSTEAFAPQSLRVTRATTIDASYTFGR